RDLPRATPAVTRPGWARVGPRERSGRAPGRHPSTGRYVPRGREGRRDEAGPAQRSARQVSLRPVKILLVTPMPPSAHAPGAIPLVLHAQLVGLLARHEVTLVTVPGAEAGEHDSIEELRQQGVDVHVVKHERPRGTARWRRRFRMAATWTRGRYPWRTVWFADPRIQN